jgi:hypothetical protein
VAVPHFNPNIKDSFHEVRQALLRIWRQLEADAPLIAALPPDAAGVSYTPTTPAHWPGGVDPGDVDDALDALAQRPKGEFRIHGVSDFVATAIL